VSSPGAGDRDVGDRDDASPRPGPPLGRLGRTHQLEGALRCYPEGELEAELLLEARVLDVEGHGLLPLRHARRHGAALLLIFQGFRTPESARALVNARLRLDPSDAAAARRLEAAHPIRVGVPVSVDGAPFGHLEELVKGPQLLLRVRAESGTFLVPAAAPYVTATTERVELVDPPGGLLDEPEPA
jgi:ribosomal 30S subunit maturation factor RimM